MVPCGFQSQPKMTKSGMAATAVTTAENFKSFLTVLMRSNVCVHPLAEAGEARCSESGATKG